MSSECANSPIVGGIQDISHSSLLRQSVLVLLLITLLQILVSISNTMKSVPYISYLFLVLSIVFSQAHARLYFDTVDLTLLVNDTKTITLLLYENIEQTSSLVLHNNHPDLLTTNTTRLIVNASSKPQEWTIKLFTHDAGHDILSVNSSSTKIDTDDAFVRITIQHSYDLAWVSVVIGWLYFCAWSISFYPQMYENWSRKSVVGLNFDFICLNLLGFILYSMFNIGLWMPEIEQEYFERYPRGHNPVQMNDIFFSVHAVFATLITVFQCICYERGDQQVSRTAKLILFLYGVIIAVLLVTVNLQTISWLDFLYYCSYIKLSITLIKYIPQAIMNYKRQSTVGWSIGNIFLDFTGGTLSIFQMIINAYNYNDWESIFGDPTKFGLGLLSIIFDIVFFLQHYVFYRGSNYQQFDNYTEVEEEDAASSSSVEKSSDNIDNPIC